jgi:hypothetical protein
MGDGGKDHPHGTFERGTRIAFGQSSAHERPFTVTDLHARECILALSAFGFRVRGQTPIRIMLAQDARRVFVPRHGRLSDGEVESILAASGISRSDFERACAELALETRPSRVDELAPLGSDASDGASFSRILERFGWRDAG